jgi:hypothetical protein
MLNLKIISRHNMQLKTLGRRESKGAIKFMYLHMKIQMLILTVTN